MDTMIDATVGQTIFLASVFGWAVLLLLVCFGAWRVDHDPKETKKDKDFFKKTATTGEPAYLDAGLQTEYAKSWLEGRYMGDDA